MLNISQDQAIRRYDTLPKSLKDAIFSDYTNIVVLESAHSNHLDDYQINALGIIVGDILMGFIHPADLEKELKDDLGLEPLVISDIAKEINQKVLAPLTADIEKNYNPEISAVEPIRVEEAGQEPPQPMEPAPAPFAEKEKPPEIQASPQPIKIEAEAPVSEKKISPLAEKTAAAASASPADFKNEKSAGQPVPAAEPVKAEPAPLPLEPTVIHEEQAAPLQKSINLGDFQIELPQSKKPVAAAVAAEFEMGNYRAPAAGTASKQPVPPPAPKAEIPRVVHYSAYSTPLSQIQNGKAGQPKSAPEPAGQPRQGFPPENLVGQANQNAFAQLGKTKPAENMAPKYPDKNAPAVPLNEAGAKAGEKPAAKFINLNDFGTVGGADKNADAAPKGPEIKGNTVDFTK